MTLIDFISQFPDEESCKQKFKEYRDHVGVVCSKCGGVDHYWKKDKEQYECKHCKTRTTLKSGTVMHKSKLPFRYWFIAMHLLTSTKKTFSAKEIQRQLGHNRYHPVWHMVHKLRQAMGRRDDEYVLAGCIELDEGYFSTEIPEEEKDKPLKRGRGSQRKSKVLVMAESEMVESVAKGQKPRRVRYLKMKAIDDLSKETINNAVKELAADVRQVDTDESTGLRADKTIILTIAISKKLYPEKLRVVEFHDHKNDELLAFLTNSFEVSALEVAYLYQNRWQIEVFFKWIKTESDHEEILGTFSKCRKNTSMVSCLARI